MKICIGHPKPENFVHKPVLNRMAETCERLGHKVVWWQSPGDCPKDCDMYIWWNGLASWARDFRQKHPGKRYLFVELAWFPRGLPVFQADPEGISYYASWSQDELPQNSIRTELKVDKDKDFLAIMQVDGDVQLRSKEVSPWFTTMAEFLGFLDKVTLLPIKVRPNPWHAPSEEAVAIVEGSNHLRWDEHANESIAVSMADSLAVLVVNSTCGAEAMLLNKPVVTFGNSVYRHFPAAYQCSGVDARYLMEVFSSLKAHSSCKLTYEAQEAMIRRILEKQWSLDTIPDRLALELRRAERALNKGDG